jgi:beta-fructofuranosidase
MVECPDILQIDSFDIIVGSIEGTSSVISPRNVKYTIGNLEIDNTFFKQKDKFKDFDIGFDFYAPQSFEIDGDTIIIG